MGSRKELIVHGNAESIMGFVKTCFPGKSMYISSAPTWELRHEFYTLYKLLNENFI